MLYDTTRDKAVAVAERIRESFAAATQEVDGRPLCATVSIGLAYCEQPALDVPEMLAQSDQALYFAKENGRNKTHAVTTSGQSAQMAQILPAAFSAPGSQDR